MRIRIILTVVCLIAAFNCISVRAKEKPFEDDVEQLIISKDVKRLLRQTGKICARVILRAEKQFFEMQKREAAIREDAKLLAEVAYHENWYTDREHLAAYYTMAVVMNRVKSPKWPGTVKEVLYQKGQYTTTKKFYTEKIPQECYDMAVDVLRNGTPDVPENVVYQATFVQGHGDWINPINGEHFCYE